LLVVPVIYYQIKRFEEWFGQKIGTRSAKPELHQTDQHHSNGHDSSNGHYPESIEDEDEEAEAPSPMEV
ncbi:MAG: hypothetical protein AAGM67_07415, partial [Bacteroidota bacterium]